MDANKMHWEKAKWKQHKNATSYFEQILEATPPQNSTNLPFQKPSK